MCCSTWEEENGSSRSARAKIGKETLSQRTTLMWQPSPVIPTTCEAFIRGKRSEAVTGIQYKTLSEK
jgi:hypothetical protein